MMILQFQFGPHLCLRPKNIVKCSHFFIMLNLKIVKQTSISQSLKNIGYPKLNLSLSPESGPSTNETRPPGDGFRLKMYERV